MKMKRKYGIIPPFLYAPLKRQASNKGGDKWISLGVAPLPLFFVFSLPPPTLVGDGDATVGRRGGSSRKEVVLLSTCLFFTPALFVSLAAKPFFLGSPFDILFLGFPRQLSLFPFRLFNPNKKKRKDFARNAFHMEMECSKNEAVI